MIYDPTSTETMEQKITPPNNFPSSDKMPIHLLPSPFSDMAMAIVESARVPPSLAGCCILGALSASIGSGLRVKSGPDRYSHSNLYILASALSGSGKSEAFRLSLAPFFEAEKSTIKEWTETVYPRAWAEKLVAESQIEKLKREAKKNSKVFDMEDIKSAIEKQQRLLVQIEAELEEPSYSIEDATTEVLALRLHNPSESLASLSADSGTIINNLFGRYNKSGRTDESIYLKAWSGDQCKVDRIQRPPIILNHPRMTALWLAQPDKLDSLIREKSFSEGGLIPRLLVCHTECCPTQIPETIIGIPTRVGLDYADTINQLITTFRGSPASRSIFPSKLAQDQFRGHYNDIASRMSEGDLQDVIPYASRWTEQAWRISVCLHASIYKREASKHELSVETARDAICLVDWFASNQLKILEGTRAESREQKRKKLVTLLKENGGSTGIRDLVARNGYSKDELDDIVLLNPNNFCKLKKETGGRPTEIIMLEVEN